MKPDVTNGNLAKSDEDATLRQLKVLSCSGCRKQFVPVTSP